MKILVSHYLLDDDNPPARILRVIGRELEALGHAVRIHRSFGAVRAARPAPAQGSAAAGGVRRLIPLVKNRLWFAKAVARNAPMLGRDLRAIAGFQPDVILARQDAYCGSMSLAARLMRVPLVVYADAPVAYEVRLYHGRQRWHPPRLVEAVERWGLKQSRAITTISHPSARKLAEYGLDRPIAVVPNGIEPERFPELAEEERRELRRAHRLTAPRILGFQGNFKTFQGIDRLRDLMLASARRGDAQWLLIGDGPERAALQDAVTGRVAATFLGQQPPEAMGRLLSLIDVAVAPHQYVSGIFYLSPLKIIECAAAGCAVVASDQGDIPWLLDDGRAGLVLSDPAIAAWTAAIDRLLDDDPLRRALGRAARRHVLAHFSWRSIAERHERHLQAVFDREAKLQVGAPASEIAVIRQ
jgi:glycosyltransferase involved in cell wall biosynthesis